MNNSMNFTQKSLISLKIPAKGRIEMRDTKIKGLRLRLNSKGEISFSVVKRISGENGKTVRVTIGKYPDVSIPQARKRAQKHLADLAAGKNPGDQKKQSKLSSVTLFEAYEMYIASKNLKPNTRRDYKSLMNNQLRDVAQQKLNQINGEQVLLLHARLSQKSKARADYAMRLLRAIFNFMDSEAYITCGKKMFADNPVKMTSSRREKNGVKRRQTHIRPKELPDFARALQSVRKEETPTGQSVCDAMLFALLTGLRVSEVLSLMWEDVNLDAGLFVIKKTKNGHPLELPITDNIKNIFECRLAGLRTDYVFSAQNQFGQIRSPRKVVQKVMNISQTSCNFHDLRRTFATTAEHLDIGTYKLKRLMNHATNSNDVTAGYVVLTPETLRPASEVIQNKIIDSFTNH